MALNFVLPDFVGDHPAPVASFLIHVTDAVVMILAVFSWGASSASQMFLLGFPASATIFALLCIIFQRVLCRRKVTNYDA